MGRVTRQEIARAMAVHSLSDDLRTHSDADETELVVGADGEVTPTRQIEGADEGETSEAESP